MLMSLILYGSRARGDHRPHSDVDLLGIVPTGSIRREVRAGGTSIYQYPSDLLLEKSREGDLFTLHLVKEGISLHDSNDFFKTVRSSFAFKSEYTDEIEAGYLVIKFFQSRPSLLSNNKARKRLVWAIRTILIARCAENRRACFSSAALARVSGLPALKGIVDNRHSKATGELLAAAGKVANKFAADRARVEWPLDLNGQRELMESCGGLVRDTLRFIRPPRTLRPRTVPPVERRISSDYG